MAAKSNLERLAVIEERLDQNSAEHRDIKGDIQGVKSDTKQINDKLDLAISNKADKEELLYWRNVLVSGIGVSILLTLLSLILEKIIK